MKLANRKAKSDREALLSALEGFANLGEKPEDWKRFRLKWPDFFPSYLSEWFYVTAEEWYRKFHAMSPTVRAGITPPLLFYRDRLRVVWTRKDDDGVNLKLLLGFEQEARSKGAEEPRFMLGLPFRPKGKRKLSVGTFIPGQPLDIEQQTTVGGLPRGRPIVNGVTGAITWEFGCTLQQSVYHLMEQRWRAMVCPQCGKFFLADKTRQRYCSPRCCGDMKATRQLDYWNRKGRFERDKRRAKPIPR